MPSAPDVEATALQTLSEQKDVSARVVVVDNASEDDSLDLAAATGIPFEVIQTGSNLGYTGGNNVGFEASGLVRPVLVCNPDVAWTDPGAIAELLRHLAADRRLAAVAPVIFELPSGLIEHLDSCLDLDRARAVHTSTHLSRLPAATPSLKPLDWLDGAAILFNPIALRDVGTFDPRYFLLAEDVEWSIRARQADWRLGLATKVSVEHWRSSSLGPAGFGSYYYFRNLYLLCRTYSARNVSWRGHLLVRALRAVRRHPANRQPLEGMWDAMRGHWGAGRYANRTVPAP